MTDLRSIVAEAMSDSFSAASPDVYVATAEDVLDALAATSNRATLVEWLVNASIVNHSGLWAVPDDPGEELVRLAGLPDTDDETELDRRLDDEGLLREALNRTADVYREGEARPRCTRALYEIGDDRG